MKNQIIVCCILIAAIIIIILFGRHKTRISYFISKNNNNDRYSTLDKALKVISSLYDNEKKFFSQHGEDGVTLALLKGMKAKYRYYVEFGVGTMDAHECNTRIFRDKIDYPGGRELFGNWSGLLLDGGFDNLKINLHKEFLYYHNIVSLFKKYNVPKRFDVLSVDTDHKDFWLLKSILEGGYRPRIIINEFNSNLGPYKSLVIGKDRPEQLGDFTHWFGFSVKALWLLARKHGYSTVYCESTGVNCFTVIDGKEGFGEGFKLSDYYRSYHAYTAQRYIGHHGPDPKKRPYVTYSP